MHSHAGKARRYRGGRFIELILRYYPQGLALLFIIFTPKIFSRSLLRALLPLWGRIGIAALGMAVAVMSGHVDASFPGIIALTAVGACRLMESLGELGGILVGVLIGAAVGAVNWLLVSCGSRQSRGRSLLITLLVGRFLQDLAGRIGNGENIPLSQVLGDDSSCIMELFRHPVGALSLFAVVAVLLYAFLEYTGPGRRIRWSEPDLEPESFRFSGTAAAWMPFVISGTLAALAGIVLLSWTSSANASLGRDMIIPPLLAVTLGGMSLKDGAGSVPGVVLGSLLLALLINAMNVGQFSTYLQSVLLCALLGLAAWRDWRG